MPDHDTALDVPAVAAAPTSAPPGFTGNTVVAPAAPPAAGHRCGRPTKAGGTCPVAVLVAGSPCRMHNEALQEEMALARRRGGIASQARKAHQDYGLGDGWRPDLTDDTGIIAAAEDIAAGVSTGRLSAAAATAAGAVLRVAVDVLREKRDVDLAALAHRLEEQTRKR